MADDSPRRARPPYRPLAGGLVVLSLLAAAPLRAENGVPPPAPSCAACPPLETVDGAVAIGAGYLFDDAYAFGDTFGRARAGTYPVLDAALRWTGEGGQYGALHGADLGLDRRALALDYGRQGRFGLSLDYTQTPQRVTDSGETVYRLEDDRLVLPEDWGHTPPTGLLPDQAETLHPLAIGSDRRRLGAGFVFFTPQWDYTVQVSREHKEGMGSIAGAFGTSFGNAQSTLLPRPIDALTEELEATAAYRGPRGTWQIGYHAALYRNGSDALAWDNAFDTVGGAGGQLALPPDNQFHQIHLAGDYHLGERTRLRGRWAVGRASQDEPFLEPTVNATLSAPALPRDTLQGQVWSAVWDGEVVSQLSPRWRLVGSYRHEEQADETPRDAFQGVVNDTALATGARANTPYSFRKRQARVSSAYTHAGHKARAGASITTHERTFQEVDQTVERRAWADWRWSTRPLDVAIAVARSRREGDAYTPVETTDPPQNPLLRKFNLADRLRDEASVRLSRLAAPELLLGVTALYAEEAYPDSPLGLQASRETSATADAAFILTERLRLHLFVGRDCFRSRQTGSEAFTTPDWSAVLDDTIDTGGMGADWTVTTRLEVGIDYTGSRSTGAARVSGAAFPEQTVRLDRIDLTVRYRWDERRSVRLQGVYEHYRESDWVSAGLAPDSIPSVLTLGSEPTAHRARALTAALQYRF